MGSDDRKRDDIPGDKQEDRHQEDRRQETGRQAAGSQATGGLTDRRHIDRQCFSSDLSHSVWCFFGTPIDTGDECIF
jgi:hypothetical protein